MRKLTNSLAAGMVLALLVAESVFLLNPDIPHTWKNVISIFGTFAISYGIGVGGVFWLLLYGVELARGRPLGPAWLSYRVLTWLLMLTFSAGAALLWHNLVHVRVFIPAETLRGLAVAATLVTTAAAVLLVVALFHYSFGRRGVLVSYAVSALFVGGALVMPLLLRPEPLSPKAVPRMPIEDYPSARKITILGMEGASMSYVLPAVAEGKLPNFARLIDNGAAGSLRTLYPTDSLAVWTSMATGKLPRDHGLKGFYRYRFPGVATPVTLVPRGTDFPTLDRLGLLRRSAVTGSSRRSQPFWSILSRFGVEVGLVRWWGTYPAEEVQGFIVSEYFHRQIKERFDPPLPELTFPPELSTGLSSRVVLPEDVQKEALGRFVDLGVEVDSDFQWEEELGRAFGDDATYRAIGEILKEEFRPDVFGIYFFGLDIVGHYFTRFDRPAEFGDVKDEEIRKFGHVIDAYYRYLDEILGDYLHARSDDEIVMVVSGHGIEPLSLARRVLEPLRGNPHLSGFHDDAPDGLWILEGPDIRAGVKIQGASILDVTPTLLYLMDLPLGQDMDGQLLSDVIEPELARSQPVTFISSYHDFLIETPRLEDPADARSPLDAVPAPREPR